MRNNKEMLNRIKVIRDRELELLAEGDRLYLTLTSLYSKIVVIAHTRFGTDASEAVLQAHVWDLVYGEDSNLPGEVREKYLQIFEALREKEHEIRKGQFEIEQIVLTMQHTLSWYEEEPTEAGASV